MGWAALLLATGFALQPVGTFHGDEPVARDGERWLALESVDGRMRLAPARVRVGRVHDPVLDADGEATGTEVDAPGVPAATMLLRGPGLRAGAIEAGEVTAAREGDVAAFRFRGADYRLMPRCPATPPAGEEAQACEIVLASARGTQPIARWQRWRGGDGRLQYDEDARPTLLHVADFDRDGRPDLILDTADHYNADEPTLLLSAPAARGQHVRRVASLRSVGC